MKALLAFALLLGVDDRVDRLSENHKEWIEKEVLYIISDKEREAFLDLESEEERVAFVAAFWQRRDPDPVTPLNEFREEHYRRLAHVERLFGRESAVPGWMTDRGKIYIILGEPDDREDFTSVPMLYPTEVWFYQQDRDKALPPLNFLFWQEHAVGPYRMFNHFLDDPEDLMPAQPMNRENSRMEAYINLQEMSPSLAHAALTMRADQGAMANIHQPDRAGLDFQALLSDIYVSPFRRVDTRYVDEAGIARGLVEADYLFNFVPSVGMSNVLPGPNGAHYVHYSIEILPQHMTMAHDPDKNTYYTSFELRGEVTTVDESETVVHGFTRQPFIQLTPAQFQDVGTRQFSYRDMFPLVGGAYRMRIVLKNSARSEYTIFESELNVPESAPSGPWVGAPVPLYGFATMKPTDGDAPEPYRSYQLGTTRLNPNAARTVAIGNHIMAYVPLANVPDEHELRLTVSHADDGTSAGPLVEETHRLDFYERPVVVRTPLQSLQGGRYRFTVELRDPSGASAGTQSFDFDISPLSTISEPWVLREGVDGENAGLVYDMLSAQSMRLERTEAGRAFAEKALDADPNALGARLVLARFQLDSGAFSEAIRLLEPARAQAPRDADILLTLGDAHFQARSYARAVELFELAVSIRRPDVGVLNALGIGLAELGRTERAIGYLERSIEQAPDQAEVQELLATLRALKSP